MISYTCSAGCGGPGAIQSFLVNNSLALEFMLAAIGLYFLSLAAVKFYGLYRRIQLGLFQ